MKWKLIALLAIVSLLQVSSQAGVIRISFLTDDAALQNTLDFLRDSGCKKGSIAAFQDAVKHYNSTFSNFDYSKFPKAQNGFYRFQSAPQLLSALPQRLSNTPHAYELNCFDTVIILANGKFRTTLHPNDRGVFIAAITATNGALLFTSAKTAKESFDLSYPKWYQVASDGYIPSSIADARINLTAAMCFHELPTSTNDRKISDQVINALRASWKNQAIEFPSDFQIVMCHQVKLTDPYHLFVTTHAGLLFKHDKNYTYIEKDGGSGPFVRLEFEDKSDLAIWLSGMFVPKAQDYVFATFNDSEIETLPVD